ncbi:hypothetical protein BD410DRAFT_822286 [Rickenella mellea]|uniref:F-box domain-containing protein n=1 Tax=Rickenella mellea TaxID=50990 RepID=A0A4Y7PU52_9AGAM|nr:hypothetical protein BD410DRAFT_822286 [Rickenella mellea]
MTFIHAIWRNRSRRAKIHQVNTLAVLHSPRKHFSRLWRVVSGRARETHDPKNLCFVMDEPLPLRATDLHVPNNGYDSTTSFILQMPPEIMSEIFSLCIPTTPSFRVTDAPLLLTHVNSSWRACAISNTTFWDHITLPSPVVGLPQGIVELCKIWLERSGNRNLTVDLSLASDYQNWRVPVDHLSEVRDVVKILRTQSRRIQKLLRVLPQFLKDDLPPQEMDILEELFICEIAEQPLPGRHGSFDRFIVPTTLRNLSLRQTCFGLRNFSSLSQLSHLDLWQLQGPAQTPISACLAILRDFPQLESCTLDVAPGYLAPEPHRDLVMPSLTFFFVSWDWLVDVGPIFDIVRTPALQRLGLRGPPPTRNQWCHLKSFLLRCRPQITQLSIKELGFTDIQLLDCLKLCRSLTNLSLSHCSVDSAFLKALSWNPSISEEARILPCLEFLSMEACDEFDVKDLIAMLKTRACCVADGRRKLRGIRLSFCKRILEAHQEQLERCGIESVIIRPIKRTRVHHLVS